MFGNKMNKLSKLSHLDLDLSGNEINDGGYEELIESLSDLKRLEVLSLVLENNKITDFDLHNLR